MYTLLIILVLANGARVVSERPYNDFDSCVKGLEYLIANELRLKHGECTKTQIKDL